MVAFFPETTSRLRSGASVVILLPTIANEPRSIICFLSFSMQLFIPVFISSILLLSSLVPVKRKRFLNKHYKINYKKALRSSSTSPAIIKILPEKEPNYFVMPQLKQNALTYRRSWTIRRYGTRNKTSACVREHLMKRCFVQIIGSHIYGKAYFLPSEGHLTLHSSMLSRRIQRDSIMFSVIDRKYLFDETYSQNTLMRCWVHFKGLTKT